MHRRSIYVSARDDTPSQAITQTVRHRMIDSCFILRSWSRRSTFEIWHAARECSRDCETARICVVLHIILRWVSQQHRGFHFANDAGQFAQQVQAVDDLEVIRNAVVKFGAK